MSEIEFTIPTIQYGNVKFRGTPEEFGVELTGPGAIGEMVAVYTNMFTQGFQVGAKRDVEYLGSAQFSGNDSGTTDVDMTARATIQSELGATVVEQTDGPGDSGEDNPYAQESDQDLPWEKDIKAKPKPWENKGAPAKAPAPKKIDW